MRILLRTKTALLVAAATIALSCGSPTLAWGDLGHEVTALIAYRHLTPTAKTKLDALLASDPDTLTSPDFANRATWADRYAKSHPETAAWHFVNIELDHPDLSAACSGFPKLAEGQMASQGPAQDCVVDKIDEFARELADPGAPTPERLLALKFLIHFVGDVHQPLHGADNHDKGGNCVKLSPSPDGDVTNLHIFWDVTAVNALGRSPEEMAAELDARIPPAEVEHWSGGDARSWAEESYQLAKSDAYSLPSRPTCADGGPISLSPEYQAMAAKDAALRLQQAGVRMAVVLNQALASP
jgi:hypothetical protein